MDTVQRQVVETGEPLELTSPMESRLGRDAIPGRVLVVDDDPSVTRIVRAMLEVDGHQIEEVSTATGLVERMRVEPPDVLILDLHMPGVSGFDLLEQLSDARDGRIGIILLTGDSNLPGVDEMARRGVGDCLTKPVRMDELRASVRLSLRLVRATRENVALRAALEQANAKSVARQPVGG